MSIWQLNISVWTLIQRQNRKWTTGSSSLWLLPVYFYSMDQQWWIEGARIKIHPSRDFQDVQLLYRMIRQVNQTACDDKKLLTATNTGLPSSIQTALNERVCYCSSDLAKQRISSTVFTRNVSGLGGEKVCDVLKLNVLLQGNCYPFFYGGVVRNQLLRKPSADVDLEVDCEIHWAYGICNERWGSENCVINEVTNRTHIRVEVNSPDDLIDAASTSSTFLHLSVN